MSNLALTNKAGSVKLPRNGMALIISPSADNSPNVTAFDVVLYNNFAQDASKLTERDKTLFMMCQGMLSIAQNKSDMLLQYGLTVMEKFVKNLTGKDLADMDAQGNA